MKQEEGEALQDFVKRFTIAALKMAFATLELLVSAMAKGLANKYINLNEIRKMKRLEIAKHEPKPYEKGQSVPFNQRSEQFMPLKVSQTEAPYVVQSNNLLRWPRRAASGPSNPPSNKFYKFHDEYGHTIDECTHLRNELERLVKLGYLKELVSLVILAWKALHISN
ncbi:hypothetical protein CDL12_02167 [Handroanthus impetiginosus]|uniref:Retrotransposon gag domain-containing protein n=1 Tax=Handroanthus impetiginosus TaxID=429701 RepID=A0A2G9I5Q2_9LAMI|nr:hypothetical protein CDL12_02167 [Handroanthus impetiginosus]